MDGARTRDRRDSLCVRTATAEQSQTSGPRPFLGQLGTHSQGLSCGVGLLYCRIVPVACASFYFPTTRFRSVQVGPVAIRRVAASRPSHETARRGGCAAVCCSRACNYGNTLSSFLLSSAAQPKSRNTLNLMKNRTYTLFIQEI